MNETANNSEGLDIGREELGAVYGKALLGSTEPSGDAAAVLAEFESLITDVLHPFPNLDATLSSPRVSVDEKVRILDNVFASRMSDQLLTFLKVVCRHERLDCLRQIYRSARHLYNTGLGLVEVKVTSAIPIDHALAVVIQNGLRKVLRSEISIDYDVDPDLLGGMVVRAGDTVFDGSVANQLSRLRAQTLERSFQATIGFLDNFTDEN